MEEETEKERERVREREERQAERQAVRRRVTDLLKAAGISHLTVQVKNGVHMPPHLVTIGAQSTLWNVKKDAHLGA